MANPKTKGSWNEDCKIETFLSKKFSCYIYFWNTKVLRYDGSCQRSLVATRITKKTFPVGINSTCIPEKGTSLKLYKICISDCMHVFVCVVGIIKSWWINHSIPSGIHDFYMPQRTSGYDAMKQKLILNTYSGSFNPKTLGHCKPKEFLNIPKTILGEFSIPKLWDSLQTQKFQSSPKSFWMGWVGGGEGGWRRKFEIHMMSSLVNSRAV